MFSQITIRLGLYHMGCGSPCDYKMQKNVSRLKEFNTRNHKLRKCSIWSIKISLMVCVSLPICLPKKKLNTISHCTNCLMTSSFRFCKKFWPLTPSLNSQKTCNISTLDNWNGHANLYPIFFFTSDCMLYSPRGSHTRTFLLHRISFFF